MEKTDLRNKFLVKFNAENNSNLKEYEISKNPNYTEWLEDLITNNSTGDLLHKFWQRSSDACPLEAIDAEKEERDFFEWTKSIN